MVPYGKNFDYTINGWEITGFSSPRTDRLVLFRMDWYPDANINAESFHLP